MSSVGYSEKHLVRARKYHRQLRSNQGDPTQTTSLRRRYSGEAYRRFRALKGIIRENIVERDVLGIKGGRDGPPRRREVLPQVDLSANPLGPPGDPERFPDFETCVEAIMDPPATTREDAEEICGGWESNALAAHQDVPFFPPGAHLPIGRFDFPDDPQKVDEFMQWIDDMVNAGLLEAVDNPAFGAVGGTTSAWQNLYIRQAYSRGLRHAEFAAKQIGLEVGDESLELLFRNPRHASKLGLLYTRAFGELDGVTNAMAQNMRRVLAQGLTEGWGAEKMARNLNGVVDNIGINRARTIARTETVRAVNESALTRYEGLGVERVGALVEFVTAGDLRVCPICASLEGATMNIDQARGLIPVHPNCRCMWLPVPPGEKSRIRGIGPGDVVETVGPAVPIAPTSDRAENLWEQGNRASVQRQAQSAGLDEEEYIRQVNQELERLVDDAEVRTRTDRRGLRGILEDGEFKNQHQTGTSLGELNPDLRLEAERSFFDITSDSPSDHPIYGYLGPRGGGFGDDPWEVEHYGGIVFRFDDDVRDRTTFMWGDSLGEMNTVKRGSHPGRLTVPVNDPDYRAVSHGRDSPLGVDTSDLNSTPVSREHVGDGATYLESQIHGELTLDDVEEVLVVRQYAEAEPEIIERIREAGLTVRVVDEDESLLD